MTMIYLVCILAIEQLQQRFVVSVHNDVRSLEIVVLFCYDIIDTIGILFGRAPFSLSAHEGV